MTLSIRRTIGIFAALAASATIASAQSLTEAMRDRMAPTGPANVRVFATPKTDRVGPSKVERPEPEIPRAETVPPLPPVAETKPTRPRISAEPPFTLAWGISPALPTTTELATHPLATQIGADIHKAPPLPILGGYAKDRVSLADPSWDVSGSLILSPQSPERSGPAPFTPWNLPDPFENVVVIRLREAWPENPDLPVFIVAPTRR